MHALIDVASHHVGSSDARTLRADPSTSGHVKARRKTGRVTISSGRRRPLQGHRNHQRSTRRSQRWRDSWTSRRDWGTTSMPSSSGPSTSGVGVARSSGCRLARRPTRHRTPPPPASGASQRSRLSADGPSLVQQGGRFHGRRSGGAQAWLKPPLVKPRRGL